MTKTKISFIFNGFVVLLFAYATITSLGFLNLAKPYPLTVSGIGLILALINAGRLFFKVRQESQGERVAQDQSEFELAITHDFKIAFLNFLWFFFYLVGIFIVGFYISTAVFLVAFLKKKAEFKWIQIAISLVITFALFVIFKLFMDMAFPPGLLIDHLFKA